MQSYEHTVTVDPGIALIILCVFLAVYLWVCFSIRKIAKKTHNTHLWMSWFPVLQMVPLIKTAGKPTWWIVLLIVPYVNIVALPWLFICLAEKLGRSKWTGLLILVPFVNMFLIQWFAASKRLDSHVIF